ncbi:hypothetical protein [Kaistella sp.]|uniref:hypothetical protein n=1 Tax=Kaistella sp. TaxID=2782235 RepID=UPI003C4A0099
METKIFNKRQFIFTPRTKKDILEVENLLQTLGLDFEQREIEESSLSDFHKKKMIKVLKILKTGSFYLMPK